MSDCINGRKGCDTHGLHYHSPRLEITYSENEVTEKFAALRAEVAAMREALQNIVEETTDETALTIATAALARAAERA